MFENVKVKNGNSFDEKGGRERECLYDVHCAYYGLNVIFFTVEGGVNRNRKVSFVCLV